MIDETRIQPQRPVELARDEFSMRVMEYAMAFVAIAAALLIALN